MKANHQTLKLALGIALCFGGLACHQIVGADSKNHRIVGYTTSWESHIIRFDKITHLNYAFLEVNADGSLRINKVNLSRMQNVINQAKQAGVKVLISVGGGANREMTEAATNARVTLATNIKNFANQYGFDGIDVDWEGPQTTAQGEAYLALVQDLYADQNPKGKLVTTAIARWLGDFIPSKAYDYLDFVNIMSYDDNCTAANNYNHATYNKASTDLEYFVGKGVTRAKAVVGVPFYGYTVAGCAIYSGVAYKTIVTRDPSAANKDESNGMYYNGIPTIKQKALLAKNSASGVMIWQLAQDTNDENSLLSAIYDTLMK